MPPGGPPGAGSLSRVLAILAAVTLMVTGILVLAPALENREEAPPAPAAARLAPPERPIAEEADAFRIRPGDLAVAPDAERRETALPRTLQIHRTLRAYPGAPPRVPHGLTNEEFRLTLCNSCHERGGFSPRFGAYAPVTPHPEYADCLQCHAPRAMAVGIGFPEARPDAICVQCHVDPDRPPPSFVALEWPEPDWPDLDRRALEGAPPLIPHALQLRGNCQACHAGPGAVREIRTTHPEWADCRQCHLPATPGEPAFTRPLNGSAVRPEGDR